MASLSRISSHNVQENWASQISTSTFRGRQARSSTERRGRERRWLSSPRSRATRQMDKPTRTDTCIAARIRMRCKTKTPSKQTGRPGDNVLRSVDVTPAGGGEKVSYPKLKRKKHAYTLRSQATRRHAPSASRLAVAVNGEAAAAGVNAMAATMIGPMRAWRIDGGGDTILTPMWIHVISKRRGTKGT